MQLIFYRNRRWVWEWVWVCDGRLVSMLGSTEQWCHRLPASFAVLLLCVLKVRRDASGNFKPAQRRRRGRRKKSFRVIKTFRTFVLDGIETGDRRAQGTQGVWHAAGTGYVKVSAGSSKKATRRKFHFAAVTQSLPQTCHMWLGVCVSMCLHVCVRVLPIKSNIEIKCCCCKFSQLHQEILQWTCVCACASVCSGNQINFLIKPKCLIECSLFSLFVLRCCNNN